MLKFSIVKFFTVFLFALVPALPVSAALRAGEASFPNPAEQPLAVVRARNAGVIQDILATRQARALGRDRLDFAAEIPGTGARTPSLRAFFDALVRADAKNIWYGLVQRGSSLVRQAGAIGWESDNSPPDALLSDARILDTDGADVLTDGTRVVVSRDRETREELFAGAGEDTGSRRRDGHDEAWRRELASFLESPADSLGIWLNARPIFGILTLFSGLDLRTVFAQHGMRPPVWARVELFNHDNGDGGAGDLGFELRTENILPEGIGNAPASAPRIRSRGDIFAEANFPAPEEIWNALRLDRNLFALANIDVSAFVPEALAASLRRSADGNPVPIAAALLPDGDRAREQLGRVRELFGTPAGTRSSAFGIDEERSRSGKTLYRVRAGGVSFVLGIEGDFLVASPSAEDWPEPEDFLVEPGTEPCIAEWRMEDADTFNPFLPPSNSGVLRLDGDALVLRTNQSN